MRIRRIVAGISLVFAGLAAPSGAAERSRVVREFLTIESHRMVHNDAITPGHPHKWVSRLEPVDVTVYRPDDDLKHPAIVYLHGGAMNFADPVMMKFHAELASRGLVVLAPHYLLDGTGWPHWHESALNTVTLATRLPSVDPDHVGMSGLSMGGQIGLSTAARDPRIKAVAEYFTAWPGSLPGEPIAKLPPVLLLNGTADPVIPFDLAMVLDEILEEHKRPFERHVYEGLGHGFGTAAAFHDGVNRTAAFFGGRVDGPGPAREETTLSIEGPAGSTGTSLDLGDDEGLFAGPDGTLTASTSLVAKKKPKRLVVKEAASPSKIARP